jgi:hypothetical protein
MNVGMCDCRSSATLATLGPARVKIKNGLFISLEFAGEQAEEG